MKRINRLGRAREDTRTAEGAFAAHLAAFPAHGWTLPPPQGLRKASKQRSLLHQFSGGPCEQMNLCKKDTSALGKLVCQDRGLPPGVFPGHAAFLHLGCKQGLLRPSGDRGASLWVQQSSLEPSPLTPALRGGYRSSTKCHTAFGLPIMEGWGATSNPKTSLVERQGPWSLRLQQRGGTRPWASPPIADRSSAGVSREVLASHSASFFLVKHRQALTHQLERQGHLQELEVQCGTPEGQHLVIDLLCPVSKVTGCAGCAMSWAAAGPESDLAGNSLGGLRQVVLNFPIRHFGGGVTALTCLTRLL